MLISVLLGGAIGALCRYLVAKAFIHSSFPGLAEHIYLATLFVNVLGSFLLALIVFGWGDAWRPELKLGLSTGFLGAFTTFSTFEVETLRFLEKDQWGFALAYILASVGLGFLAALLGRYVALQSA